jgi:hypothetical protein
MDRYLGVIVEPWEIDSKRHDKMYDAFYKFEDKCIVSGEPEQYGQGFFDVVGTDELYSYLEDAGAGEMFIAGDPDATVELISDMDVSSEEVAFERYTVSGFVERPDKREVLKDEIRSMLPFQERTSLVEENAAYETLEDMGVPDAEVMHLTEVAQPPKNSRYYSNTSV